MKILLSTLAILLITLSSASAETLVYEGKSGGIGAGKHIVFLANDHEYRSEQSCPLMAKILAMHHGFRCTVLFGVDENGHIKAGDAAVPGMEALKDADLLVFFTRFMKLPDEQVDLLVEYFERGGPVVGIRTSTHCFNGQKGKWAKLNFNYAGDDYRGGLGEQIFGNTWHKARGQSHYGSNHQMGSQIRPMTSAVSHPILAGIESIHTYSGGYKSQPPADATPLLELQVLNTFEPSEDFNEDKPLVCAGWTRNSYQAPSGATKTARVVYTSFGASEDLVDADARRFLLNSCLWALGMENKVLSDLTVEIVGKYNPSPYSSGAFFAQNVKPQDLADPNGMIMPAGASLGGDFTDPKSVSRMRRALDARPGLKARIQREFPGIDKALDDSTEK